jgi:hypothetical protein
MVCDDQHGSIDYDQSTGDASIPLKLYFPIVLDASRLADPGSDDTRPTSKSSGCWRYVPNNKNLSEALATVDGDDGAPIKRPPGDGDGWFYRIVRSGPAIPSGQTQTMAATTYFDGKSRDDFPVSACADVTLEFAWWSSLYEAQQSGKPAAAVRYKLRVSDSSTVTAIPVPYGGVINFQASCGAYRSAPGTSPAPAIIGAVATEASAILKAEKSPSKSN